MSKKTLGRRTGSLRPKTFNYPSFPKYVASVGLAAGFLRAAREDGITNTQEIGRVSYPFYQTPTAVETARQLFAVLSVIALATTGVLAWYITWRPAAIVVAPLILTTSSFFFSQSWRYLNVDIVGTCMVALTLATCLAAAARPSVVRSAMIPGLFAGLATASKYTLGVAFLPVLLGIVMYQKDDRRLVSIIVAGATLCLMFLVAVPYSLLDLPGFLNGVASEVRHYSRGHIGFNGEPGLAQLRYYAGHITNQFGVAAGVFALIGVVAAFVRDWRRAVILLAFPLALVTLLAAQRVHFHRNVLAIYPVYAVAVSYGTLVLHGWLSRVLESRLRLPRYASAVSVALLIGLLVLTLPTRRLLEQARVTADSRNLATEWLAENIPAGWTVVIPTELGFDTRGLEVHNLQTVNVSVRTIQQQRDLLASLEGQTVALVPVWGMDGRFEAEPSPGAMNAAGAPRRTLQEFGRNGVLLNRDPPTARGNPRFRVVSP